MKKTINVNGFLSLNEDERKTVAEKLESVWENAVQDCKTGFELAVSNGCDYGLTMAKQYLKGIKAVFDALNIEYPNVSERGECQ